MWFFWRLSFLCSPSKKQLTRSQNIIITITINNNNDRYVVVVYYIFLSPNFFRSWVLLYFFIFWCGETHWTAWWKWYHVIVPAYLRDELSFTGAADRRRSLWLWHNIFFLFFLSSFFYLFIHVFSFWRCWSINLIHACNYIRKGYHPATYILHVSHVQLAVPIARAL